MQNKEEVIKKFLSDLDKNGLVEMNPKIWDIELMTNIVDRIQIAPDVFTRLLEMHYSIQDSKISEDEIMLFSFVFIARFFVSAIEYVRWILISMINNNKIKFDEQTNLGNALRLISSKLKYNKKQSLAVDNALFRELRNYLAHENYLLTKEGLTIKNNGKTTQYSLEELTKIILELKSILEIFIAFGLKKIVELEVDIQRKEKETEAIRKIINKIQKN